MFGKEYVDWLANLRVGDEVAYDTSRWGTPKYKIVTIKRITPKRSFVTSNELRFNPSGRHDSGGFHSLHIRPCTDEVRDVIHRSSLVADTTKAIDTVALDRMTNQELIQLTALINSFGYKAHVHKT